jgi:hypothetical protein
VLPAIDLSVATKACSNTNEIHSCIRSTVQLATITTAETALQQHLRDSPVHAQSFDCDDCDRSFDSEDALQ